MIIGSSDRSGRIGIAAASGATEALASISIQAPTALM